MTKEKIVGFYNDLPVWAKGVLAVGGVAIIYFTGKSLLKKLKAQGDTAKARETIRQQTADANQLAQQGMKPSYGSSQYNSWADGIKSQFDGCDISVNMVAPSWFRSSDLSGSGKYLANIFSKLNNDLDYLLLQKAYGIRTHDQCGWWTGDFTGNLSQAIADELENSEIQLLNKYLAQRGITYKI